MGEAGRRSRESRDALVRVVRNPAVRRIELAFAASVVGDWANVVAAAVYVYQQSGAFGVGALAVVRYVLIAFAGPFLATLADRYPRVRVMVVSDLVRLALVGVAAAVIALDGSEWIVYVLAILTSVAGRAFRPAQQSLLPSLVDDPADLTATNVVSSTIESTGFFAGPALGGALLAVTGIPAVYALNAATFLVSAALIAGVRPRAAQAAAEGEAAAPATEEEAPKERFLDEVTAGFRVIARDRGLRALIGVYAAQTVVAGASGVFVVVLALEKLDLGKGGVGLLDAIFGAGAVAGGAVAMWAAARKRLALDFGIGVLLWSLPLLLVAVQPVLGLAVAAFLLMGLGNSVVDINASTILQRVVPEEVMGRVFGAMESILIATMAVGALATPLLLHVGGLRLAFVVLGVAVGALTLVAMPALLRIDRVALAPAATGLLRQVAFLAPLPEQVLERLAASAEHVRVGAGTVVFREGDPGDRFYVVESGRVEILGRSFTAGQSFGEIALLRSVPRTATVTALEDSVLVALDGPAFVAAVTSQGDARDAAESVVRARLGA